MLTDVSYFLTTEEMNFLRLIDCSGYCNVDHKIPTKGSHDGFLRHIVILLEIVSYLPTFVFVIYTLFHHRDGSEKNTYTITQIKREKKNI